MRIVGAIVIEEVSGDWIVGRIVAAFQVCFLELYMVPVSYKSSLGLIIDYGSRLVSISRSVGSPVVGHPTTCISNSFQTVF